MSVAPRHSCRSPRVLRTHLHAYACLIYVIAFRASIGLRPFSPPHPATPPLSASCSSGQRFALSFLRIRSRPRHPCLRLTLPLAGCVEDFHLQVRAPCRAHEKGPPHRCGGREKTIRERQRFVPGIAFCAILLKSDITRCIDSNAGAPDCTTPCMADTTFCICFRSGIIASAIAAFALYRSIACSAVSMLGIFGI